MLRTEDSMNIDSFLQDAIEGFVPRLICGKLGLNKVHSRTAVPTYSESLFESGLNEMDASSGLKPRPEGVQV
jgi:flavine halogenase